MFIFALFCAILLFIFLKKFNHLLSIFITLEMLALYLVVIIYFQLSFSFSMMVLFFLVVSASESVLGLVLFVFFVRLYSKDYAYSLGVLLF